MTIFNNIHDKNSQKNRKRGKLQLDKGHLPKKPRPNILVKNCLPLKIRNKAYPLTSLFFNIVLEVLASAVKQEKEIKDTYIDQKQIAHVCR